MPRIARTLKRLPVIGCLANRRLMDRFASIRAWRTAPAGIVKSGPTLVGEDLLRTFGTGGSVTHALKDVSVELHRGEMNLLMGPSGSGKSTLLAVLSALLRPDAGTVKAHGRDVWTMTDQEMEKFRLDHCSYIFQGYNLFPALTARQQLEVVLQWGEGVNRREARQRADKVLDQLGLSHRAHLRPNVLSGGEKQRVAIARAMVKNPSFVFADEPTSALDWENGQLVMDMLKDQARMRGTTVLVVTHDHRLEKYADRIFSMADGSLAGDAAMVNANPVDVGTAELHPLPDRPQVSFDRVRLADIAPRSVVASAQ
jgi:putative ABC transport system ATP-binding protein